MINKYDITIGLEVHSELTTKTKAFCSCANEFGATPNSNTCPVCLALPGAIPVLNKKAVEYTIKAGLATGCTINNESIFERKNYFYPDSSKAYQISQLVKPLCEHGFLDITVNNEEKRIRINRIHLEEDAGKLTHSEFGNDSLVDYNRGGVPLIEVVSEPDISSADEAVEYVQALRNILVFLGVSDGKMQEGSLRCDVNLSIKPKGSETLGTRTEMKNLNSFRSIHRAILSEQKRQVKILEDGGTITQETRRWDDNLNQSFSLRSKEDSQDYRYFPDPDLMPIKTKYEYIEEIRKGIPALPNERKQRYMMELGLSDYDASLMITDVEISDFFEQSLAKFNNAKLISNWIMTEVMKKQKENENQSGSILISVNNFVDLLKLISNEEVSDTAARKVFEEVWGTGKNTNDVVNELELKQISNEDEILKICMLVLKENPKSVADYNAGNKKTIGFLVGQVMKKSGGKFNPQIVNKTLQEQLKK